MYLPKSQVRMLYCFSFPLSQAVDKISTLWAISFDNFYHIYRFVFKGVVNIVYWLNNMVAKDTVLLSPLPNMHSPEILWFPASLWTACSLDWLSVAHCDHEIGILFAYLLCFLDLIYHQFIPSFWWSTASSNFLRNGIHEGNWSRQCL